MDWSISSETVETLEYREHAQEYREHALGNEFPVETTPDEPEPGASNFFEEIAVAFRQCCEAGEKVYVSVVNWATMKPECPRAVTPGTDSTFLDKGEREIQLTVPGEREMNVTNAVGTEIFHLDLEGASTPLAD